MMNSEPKRENGLMIFSVTHGPVSNMINFLSSVRLVADQCKVRIFPVAHHGLFSEMVRLKISTIV